MPSRAREGDVEYVVLAAGSSRRMGFDKAVTPLAGSSPLSRIAAVCAGRSITVVTNASLASACRLAMPEANVHVNSDAERGMSTSMLVAHASIRPGATIGVLLADKPFLLADTLRRCERALLEEPCDVLVATSNGEAGHPVYFGPIARMRFADAPPGDSLRTIRDDASLHRRRIECDDAGVLDDLDTPELWFAAERRLLDVHRA